MMGDLKTGEYLIQVGSLKNIRGSSLAVAKILFLFGSGSILNCGSGLFPIVKST